MSQFRTTLNAITKSKSQAMWAERFDIGPTNFNKLLRADVPVGHRTAAKILLGLPEDRRRRLMFAYLTDEVLAISDAAADITKRPQEMMASPSTVGKAAASGARQIGKLLDHAAGLSPELQEQLKRVLRAAQSDPAVGEKLAMALTLAEK